MNTPMIDIDLETDDGLFLVAPITIIPEDRMVDMEHLSDLIIPRPDFGYATGRFAQFDDGTNTAFNRNGHMFSPIDYIDKAAALVKNVPTNMLHRKEQVVGTFIGTGITYPSKTLDVADDSTLRFPYIDAVPAIWRYHFPDAWKAIVRAHDQGACFFSMEAVSESLTCFTAACPCNGATYPYRGVRDKSYCDALNTPRARRRLNYPHYVGGAMVVPPALPGWRRADITKLHAASAIADHPDEAEHLYESFAASSPHLDPKQAEFLMAMVLAGAFEPDFQQCAIADADFEQVFHCVFGNGDDPSARRKVAKDQAEMQSEAGELVAAGIAVVAADSGRVLLLQRAVDPADPASGLWEFPGGCLEPGETGQEAAVREWCEEVGCDLPDGEFVGSWTSPNGVYQGFVYVIPSESDVPVNMDADDRQVLNPDDPDGDYAEVVAWWDPEHLPDMPALRPECRTGTDWNMVNNAGGNEGDDAYDALIDSEFTAKKMAELGKAGKAFRNANGEWSYPTPDKGHWFKARQAVGRAAEGDRTKLISYLKRRASSLGIPDNEIPEAWK